MVETEMIAFFRQGSMLGRERYVGIEGHQVGNRPYDSQDALEIRHRQPIAWAQRKNLPEILRSRKLHRLVVKDEIGPSELLNEESRSILLDDAGRICPIRGGSETV